MSLTSRPPGAVWFPNETPDLVDPVQKEMSLPREFFRILARHKLLMLLVFVLVVVGGFAVTAILPYRYSASSVVLVEPTRKEAVSLRDVITDTPADAEAIASELEVLSSRELLEQVSQKLNLVNNPEFNPALTEPLGGALRAQVKAFVGRWLPLETAKPVEGEVRPMNDVVDAVRRNLTVLPVGRSRAIRITFVSGDPKVSSAFVNALADAYLGEHLDARERGTQEANTWIGTRMAELKARADASARAVADYRASHGLVQGRDTLLIRQEISEVSTQLTSAQAKREDAQAALSSAQRAISSGQSDQLGTVLASLLIQRLRAQEADLTARRADIIARTGPAHPSAIAATAELREVQGRIAAEVSRIMQSLRSTVSIAQASEDALKARIADLQKKAGEATVQDVGLQERQREADADNAIYQAFLTRSKETDPGLLFPTVNVRVISRAVPPDRPSAPNKRLMYVAFLLAGAVVAAGVAFIRDAMKSGVRTGDEIERLIGVTPIGIIPMRQRRSSALDKMALDEAVASLWARLMLPESGRQPRSVLITSAVPREGKTTVARLMGLTAARRGQRVLLIDADLRRSSLTAGMTRATSGLGLAEIVRGEAEVEDVAVEDAPNLWVLPAGNCVGSPIHLLASGGFTTFLRKAEEDYDVVILDSPPVLVGADSWLLACNAEATIMLARWGRTPLSAITAALRQLSDVRARCVGVALSIVDPRKYAKYDATVSASTSRRLRQYYGKLATSE